VREGRLRRVNLAQARALVTLLEDAGSESWATIKRSTDINSSSYDLEVHSPVVASKRVELLESGEVEAYD
jgi:hypothetical protein